MYPYIQIVLPSYEVMAFLGGIIALLFVYFRLDTYQIIFTEFLKLFFICAASCFVGSKLLFIGTKLPVMMHDFSIQNVIQIIIESGFVFYGGLFGVIAALVFYTRNDKYMRKKLFALITPAIPLFHSFGRIGCLLAGCCYGKTLEQPIGIAGFVEFYKIPVPLLEAAFEFVLFLILLLMEKRAFQGDLLQVYLITYAVFRFANEFFRGDEARGRLFMFSTSQWISMGVVIFYFIRMIKQGKRREVTKETCL